MLTVKFLSGEEDLSALKALGLERLDGTSDFFMFEEEQVKAVMSLRPTLDGICYIDRIFFKDVEEDDKTFFLHVMMFKLRDSSPMTVAYAGDIPLWNFGFERDGEYMKIFSGDINLFYNCGGKHFGNDRQLH